MGASCTPGPVSSAGAPHCHRPHPRSLSPVDLRRGFQCLCLSSAQHPRVQLASPSCRANLNKHLLYTQHSEKRLRCHMRDPSTSLLAPPPRQQKPDTMCESTRPGAWHAVGTLEILNLFTVKNTSLGRYEELTAPTRRKKVWNVMASQDNSAAQALSHPWPLSILALGSDVSDSEMGSRHLELSPGSAANFI